jgi:hypothetical protein
LEFESNFCSQAKPQQTSVNAAVDELALLSVKLGTDVMILKIFSPKKIAKKLAFFDSKQSLKYAKF